MDITRIEALASEQGKSLTHLCFLIGKGRDYLRTVRNKGIRISREHLEAIAADLGTTAEYLAWETDDAAPKSDNAVKIPILGEVAAGIPIAEQENVLGYEEISRDMAVKGEHFGLIVKGGSMEPRIFDGDTVIVRKQDFCESGKIAIVLVENEAVTCKKVVFRDNGIELISLNPLHPPMFYGAEAVEKLPVTIIGVVVRVIRDFE